MGNKFFANRDILPKLWRGKEYFWEKDKIANCLTVILKTTGCYWAKKSGCRMCGYIKDSIPDISEEEVEKQLGKISEGLENRTEILKIFTSGSFFDDFELTKDLRSKIYDIVEEHGIKKLIVESRPEFVEKAIETSDRDFHLEIGIGLETTNDFIRNEIINKGFSFDDFRRSSNFLKSAGISVKAYLLLKPPFISEGEAIRDILNSIEILEGEGLADIVSLNLMNVQSSTYVEFLWNRKLYRPPWLWSAIEILKKSKVRIISDPVAGGKRRGPHNCGKCDRDVINAIKNFSLTQDNKILNKVDCDCRVEWEDYITTERINRIPTGIYS